MSIPRVGVLLVFQQNPLDNPEYLCVYQAASGLWGFPKGRWKKFETYIQGACRELLEETGIKLQQSDLSMDFMYHIKRGKHHHYYFIKEVTHKPIVTVDGDEIIGYKWMTIDELSKIADQNYINKGVSYFTDQAIKRIKETTFEPVDNEMACVINTISISA